MARMTEQITIGKRFIRVFRNFSFLIAGNLAGQFLGLIGLILITGYLEVSDYGIYSIITAYVSIFLLFTLPQMNKVMVREGSKKEKELREILSRNMGLRIVLGWISIGLCIAPLPFLGYPLETKLLIALYAITLMLSSLNTYYMIIYQVYEKLQFYSMIDFSQKFFYLVFVVLIVTLDLGLPALVFFSVATLLIALVLNIAISKRFAEFRISLKVNLDWKFLKPVIIFSLINFLGYISMQINIIMLSVMRPASDVGLYAFATRLVEPGFILRNLAFIATFPMFVKTYNSKDSIGIKSLFQYGFVMGAIVLMGATILSLLSEPLIILVFGEKWASAAPIFSVLVFFLAFTFIEMPFYNALQATGNEVKLLHINWIPPLLLIPLNLVFLQRYGLIGIAYSTMIVGVVGLVLHLWISYVTLKDYHYAGKEVTSAHDKDPGPE